MKLGPDGMTAVRRYLEEVDVTDAKSFAALVAKQNRSVRQELALVVAVTLRTRF